MPRMTWMAIFILVKYVRFFNIQILTLDALGYAVTSGKFNENGDTWYFAGAPRDDVSKNGSV